jgi:hypothetical protein
LVRVDQSRGTKVDVANTACIFCGRTGATVKITKEHTFSDWINEVLTPAALGPDITCERSISEGPGVGWLTRCVKHTSKQLVTATV